MNLSYCNFQCSYWHIDAFGSRQAKKSLRVRAICADSDHPPHAQSIIRALLSILYILCYPIILFTDSEGPDQPARMRRLIWAFAVRIWSKTCFRIRRSTLLPEICTSVNYTEVYPDLRLQKRSYDKCEKRKPRWAANSYRLTRVQNVNGSWKCTRIEDEGKAPIHNKKAQHFRSTKRLTTMSNQKNTTATTNIGTKNYCAFDIPQKRLKDWFLIDNAIRNHLAFLFLCFIS